MRSPPTCCFSVRNDPVVSERTWTEEGLTFAALSQVVADLLTSPGRGTIGRRGAAELDGRTCRRLGNLTQSTSRLDESCWTR